MSFRHEGHLVRVAAEEILRRFPDWDVDWADAELAQTSTVRGWKTLPLIIEKAHG